MRSATVSWNSEGGVVTTGVASVHLQALPDDRHHWAVFDGARQVGFVRRRADDETPAGEELLLARLARFFDSLGRRPRWEADPARDWY
jgi:hypothetical protein